MALEVGVQGQTIYNDDFSLSLQISHMLRIYTIHIYVYI